MNKKDGIYGDSEFLEHLYLHHKKKDELINAIGKKKYEKVELESCEHYLCALKRCLKRIKKLENRDGILRRTYLDYIRDNLEDILIELELYARKAHFANLVPVIENIKCEIETLGKTNFQMSESDKAIVNQYVHAYKVATKKKNCSNNVYRHIGNLLINYIKLLTDRYYTEKLGREDVTFDQFREEVNHVITKLKQVDLNLAKKIQMEMNFYCKFRSDDDVIRKSEREAIKGAILAYHKLKTKHFYEYTIQDIEESIEYIKMSTMKKTREIFKQSNKLNPIYHIMKFCLSPRESAKGLIKWGKENPCKAMLLGINIVTFMGVSIAFPFVFTSVCLGFSSHMGITGVVAVTKVISEKYNANKKIAELKAKRDQIQRLNEEGLRFEEHLSEEELFRNRFREKFMNHEENKRKKREQKEHYKRQRQQQFDEMNEEDLNETQTHFSGILVSIREELNTTTDELLEAQLASSTMLSDLKITIKAQEATGRLINRLANNVNSASVVLDST